MAVVAREFLVAVVARAFLVAVVVGLEMIPGCWGKKGWY